MSCEVGTAFACSRARRMFRRPPQIDITATVLPAYFDGCKAEKQSVFAVKMRLRDFLKIVEIPTLVISNICKMALGSNIRFRVIDGLQ